MTIVNFIISRTPGDIAHRDKNQEIVFGNIGYRILYVNFWENPYLIIDFFYAYSKQLEII